MLVVVPPKIQKDRRGDEKELPQLKLMGFDMLLKKSWKRGDLPQGGEYLELFEWTDETAEK